MSDTVDDPHCPECGEPIGQTATYCMHCSTDLTEERAAADADEDGVWDQSEATPTASPERSTGSRGASSGDSGTLTAYGRTIWEAIAGSTATEDEADGQLLAPDGLVDNALTALIGIAGGIVVGLVGTVVLGVVTGSGWAVGFGLLAWLGATAYLVRRRTVQGAVAKSSYAVAIVLLAVPLIALSPVVSMDGGIEERGGLFVVLLVFVALPAGVAAGIGLIASQFVPEPASANEG
ncbi:MAG: zinc-ribbon domain-containing protein [Haloarcula sp.]